MRGHPTCPRCGGTLDAPGMWESSWRCQLHGPVAPVMPFPQPGPDWARHLAARVGLPMWVPWPLPRGWVITALLSAGDAVAGFKATATALSGPNPLGGPGELLLVAEEPQVGLGARHAGLDQADPGAVVERPPITKLTVQGRPMPLWCVDAAKEKAVYVGETYGLWLWLVFAPDTAGSLLLEDLRLADLRDLGDEVDLLPFGAVPPWLQTAEG